jgi:hypothetical protein
VTNKIDDKNNKAGMAPTIRQESITIKLVLSLGVMAFATITIIVSSIK